MEFRGPFRFSKLLAFLASRNTNPIEVCVDTFGEGSIQVGISDQSLDAVGYVMSLHQSVLGFQVFGNFFRVFSMQISSVDGGQTRRLGAEERCFIKIKEECAMIACQTIVKRFISACNDGARGERSSEGVIQPLFAPSISWNLLGFMERKHEIYQVERAAQFGYPVCFVP
jgi:hypothetical protein